MKATRCVYCEVLSYEIQYLSEQTFNLLLMNNPIPHHWSQSFTSKRNNRSIWVWSSKKKQGKYTFCSQYAVFGGSYNSRQMQIFVERFTMILTHRIYPLHLCQSHSGASVFRICVFISPIAPITYRIWYVYTL